MIDKTDRMFEKVYSKLADADGLSMAIRLVNEGRCTPDIYNLLGCILNNISEAAAKILLCSREHCGYKELLSSADTHNDIRVQLLELVNKRKVRCDSPREAFNYLYTAARNRLKNLCRDTHRRQRRCRFVTFSECKTPNDINDIVGDCDIAGKRNFH